MLTEINMFTTEDRDGEQQLPEEYIPMPVPGIKIQNAKYKATKIHEEQLDDHWGPKPRNIEEVKRKHLPHPLIIKPKKKLPLINIPTTISQAKEMLRNISRLVKMNDSEHDWRAALELCQEAKKRMIKQRKLRNKSTQKTNTESETNNKTQ